MTGIKAHRLSRLDLYTRYRIVKADRRARNKRARRARKVGR